MVKSLLTIGVLAVQGDVNEHIDFFNRACRSLKKKCRVLAVNNRSDIDNIDALVIPGGESTAIGRIIVAKGIWDAIAHRINENSLPIMGTCAGCVLLAKKLEANPEKIKLLAAIDMEVSRNAFGRQKDSFETAIKFANQNDVNAVFIRAPLIKRVWNDVEVLARCNDQIVAVRQGKFLALSFHPELTDDYRVHKYFLNCVV